MKCALNSVQCSNHEPTFSSWFKINFNELKGQITSWWVKFNEPCGRENVLLASHCFVQENGRRWHLMDAAILSLYRSHYTSYIDETAEMVLIKVKRLIGASCLWRARGSIRLMYAAQKAMIWLVTRCTRTTISYLATSETCSRRGRIWSAMRLGRNSSAIKPSIFRSTNPRNRLARRNSSGNDLNSFYRRTTFHGGWRIR